MQLMFRLRYRLRYSCTYGKCFMVPMQGIKSVNAFGIRSMKIVSELLLDRTDGSIWLYLFIFQPISFMPPMILSGDFSPR